MAETKDFHIGDILSVTTGRLVSPRHIEGVYDILNWMTGESLFTHQLPRVSREAGPVLLAAHPQIRQIVFNGAHAEQTFRRHVRPLLPETVALDYTRLPSTSPAHASLSFDDKLARWRQVIAQV